MNKPKPLNTFAAIDVGSSKIAVCIGQTLPYGQVNVIGFARNPSNGVEQGIVVDIDKTIHEIEVTLRKAEQKIKEPINFAVSNLNGNHITCLNVTGSAVTHKGEVSAKQVKQALHTAQALNVDAGKEILHVLPQQYIVDNQDGIVQPLGQAGKRLDARVHLVMASSNAEQNLTKCIAKCKLPELQLIASPLAAANAVLDDASRELGVCVIDIGHDTTGVVLFVNGELRYTSVKKWGGRNVNQDIANSLFTPPQAAAELKEQHGSVAGYELDDSEVVVPGVNGQPDSSISKSALSQIIRAVYETIFVEILKDLDSHKLLDDLASTRIVLTGGASNIKNLSHLAAEVIGREAYVEQPKVLLLPKTTANGESVQDQIYVRTGVDIELLKDPAMATVVGLLRRQVTGRIKTHQVRSAKTRGVASTVARSIYRWMGGNI